MARGSKPGERRGGRSAGIPNKVTRDVKELAQAYMGDAISGLAAIAKDGTMPPAARVSAYKELLDRACGKSTQAVAISGVLGIEKHANEMTDDELAGIAATGSAGAADTASSTH